MTLSRAARLSAVVRGELSRGLRGSGADTSRRTAPRKRHAREGRLALQGLARHTANHANPAPWLNSVEVLDESENMTAGVQAVFYQADLLRGGLRCRMRFSISLPYAKPSGEWACRCEMTGIEAEEDQQECLGVDGLQAVILSLFVLRHMFSQLRKRGYAFVDAESGDPVDPEKYFDILTNKPSSERSAAP